MSQRSETTALGLTFKNPVIVASCDIARDPACFEAFAASGVGGIITKSVTDAPELQESSIARFHIADMSQRPVQGAFPDSYYFFSRGGSMMSMDALAAEAPELLAIGRRYGTVVIGSISASHPDHWVSYAKQMESLGFAALELNFGNPHGEAAKGKLGYLIGQSPDLCRQIAQAVVQAVKIPVIGMGGIMTAEDALEFILAGATAVAVGTANFIDPETTVKVAEGIEEYMRKNHVEDINELIGAVR